MTAVRRIYVYVICAVSLLVLAIGLANLLDLAFGLVWEQLSGQVTILGDETDVRREVSLYLALVAVSLPIWLLHWYLAARWSLLDRADTDRDSAVRALYFAVVLGVAVATWASNLGTIVNTLLDDAFGADRFTSDSEVTRSGAIFVVALLVWGFHGLVRDADARSMSMSGAGDWPPRFMVYAAALVGAILLLVGAAELLTLALDAIVGVQNLIVDEMWWASNLASGLSMVVVGGLVWGAHWYYSLRLLHGDDWRAVSEQSSALRRTYLHLAVLVGVVVTLVMLSESLTELLKWLFGVDPGANADPLWARLLDPLFYAAPFAVFWIVHQQIIRAESGEFADESRQIAVARLYSYVVAFLSLALASVGMAYLVGVLIEFGFETARILDANPEWVPEQISEFLSVTLIGAAVWIWHWVAIQQRVSDQPTLECTATSRRVYLYVILALATLATLGALAVVLYQALQILLGVRTAEGIASDTGTLIGIVAIAAGLAIYHLLILRGDLQYEAPADTADDPAPATGPAIASLTSAEPGLASQALPLRLTGPEDADFPAIVANLRRALPEGVELRVQDDANTVAPPENSADLSGEVPNREDVRPDDDPDDPSNPPRIFS